MLGTKYIELKNIIFVKANNTAHMCIVIYTNINIYEYRQTYEWKKI